MCLGALLGGRAGAAQGMLGETVFPGASVASVSGAEAARVNPAGVTLGRASSTRLVHVEDLRRGPSSLHATSLTWATPLPFGFGLSLGAEWVRPAGLARAAEDRTGASARAEVGLGYALDRRLSVGLRWRLNAGLDDRAAGLDGRSALDLGALYRASAQLAFGASVRGLVGPSDPAIGVTRAAVLGVAWRPTGREGLTLGLDGALDWQGALYGRAVARLGLPGFGALRAEGLASDRGDWRVSAGLEVGFGQASAALGGFVGDDDGRAVTGLVAALGWDGDRSQSSLALGSQVVTVDLDASPSTRGFTRLLLRLDRLRRDATVRGVLFAPRAEVGGLAHAEELREVFARLRGAGIRVVCHLTDASASTWYACAGADRVVLDPAGGVRIAGLRAARYYFGGALWELGVRTDFVRIGDWKSAPEQLTRTGATEAARAQEAQLLDDWRDILVGAVSRSRGVSLALAGRLVEGGPYTARDAHDAHTVDAVATLLTTQRALANSLGASRVDLDDYVGYRSARWATGPCVAVIYVDGDIVDGASSEVPGLGARTVGDQTLTEAIELAAADARVRAIVLRVDSPGGSALASDLIWRAVQLAARRKPVVASMSRVAASGGYYVAAAAREIFADPSTLTGSIGIFYGKADISRLLEGLNVGVELARRGPRADMESLFRPYTPDERRFLAARVGEFYNLFLARVAAGRHRTPAEIDRVGEGRVFVGARARGLGLVDTEGGLVAALARARVLGGLGADADVIELPSEPSSVLRSVARLVGASGDAPAGVLSRLFEQPEFQRVAGWLATVTAHHDRPMALIEWPHAPP